MPTAGSNRQLTPGRQSEERVAAELVAALNHADAPVADVYRHFYPAAVKPGFTHGVGTNTAARLDRIYAATDLLPSMLSIDTAAPNGFGDHVAVTVALVPRSARPLRSTRGAQTWPSCPTQTCVRAWSATSSSWPTKPYPAPMRPWSAAGIPSSKSLSDA
jgi:hypothetical protein